jgi:cell division protease FtsH
MSREQMTSRLAIMMGGRVAEELVFGTDKVTSGAASDIEQATKLARMMVTRWGLSPELGTVAYGENQEEVFLGYSVARQQNISEETSRKIDAEIRRLVEAGYAEAEQILTDKRPDLEILAKGLLEFETLTGDEIKDLLAGKRPVRESVIEPLTPRASAVPPAGKTRPRPEPPTGDVAVPRKFVTVIVMLMNFVCGLSSSVAGDMVKAETFPVKLGAPCVPYEFIFSAV